MRIDRFRDALAFLVLACAGCTGRGDDVGPDIPELTGDSYRVLVRDDGDRGVCGAIVTMSGSSASAASVRSGRADLPVLPSGLRTLDVAASNAVAAAGDRLVGLRFEIPTVPRDALPFVVHLPDLSASAGRRVDAGVQVSDVSVDGVLTIAAGAAVGFGTRPTDTVRTGTLAVGRLPPLPADVPGSVLTTSGVFVAPADLEVTPGATLSIAEDLGMSAGSVVPLWRLDPGSGQWQIVATGTVAAGGGRIDSSADAVRGGGLHCFAIGASGRTSISGRVVDVRGRPLSGARIRAGNAFAVTRGDGRFDLPDVATTDGGGRAIARRVDVHGGRDHRPSSTSFIATLSGASADIGDVVLDSGWTSEFRGLLIHRGRVDTQRRIALNSVDELGAGSGNSGPDARFALADIDAGDISFVSARLDPREDRNVLAIEGVAFVTPQRRTLDLRLFSDDTPWISGRRRGTQTWVVDRFGTGLISDARVFRRRGDGDEQQQLTRDNQLLRIDFGAEPSEATAVVDTSSDQRRVVSAFTAVRIETGRVELPLQRANRVSPGAFDPFGFVRGVLPVTGDVTKSVRVLGSLSAEEWFESVFEGRDFAPSVPSRRDPATTGEDTFVVGVPLPRGEVVGVLGNTTPAGFTLENVAFSGPLAAVAGGVVDIPMSEAVAADARFLLTDALAGRDAAIATSDLAFDWAIEFDDRRVLDVVRALTGNLTVAGDDVRVRLPRLQGQLAGARHLVALRGRASSAGVEREQRSFVRIGATIPVVPLLAIPVVTAPAPGATVSRDGFEVRLASPADALFTVVTLRREVAGEVRDWTAVLPQDATSFRFRKLPGDAPNPLRSGRWRLSVRSARVDSGPLTRLDLPYQRVIARWVGLSEHELQVAATASISFEVTLQ